MREKRAVPLWKITFLMTTEMCIWTLTILAVMALTVKTAILTQESMGWMPPVSLGAGTALGVLTAGKHCGDHKLQRVLLSDGVYVLLLILAGLALGKVQMPNLVWNTVVVTGGSILAVLLTALPAGKRSRGRK